MPTKHEIITISNGNETVQIFPRKSRLAKRVIISVNERKGIELIVPKRVSMKNAIAFAHKKQDWILARHRELNHTPQIAFKEGAVIPILGADYIIAHSGKLRGVAKIENDNIIISGLEEHISRKTKQFLIKTAKSEINIRANIEAKKLGVKFRKITLRDTSSRWGSCSQDGNLSFSWRLIFAPRFVFDYVVAHEIAHLIEMNHSVKYWNIVASICPTYEQAKYWLKKNGEELHLYGED